MAVSQGNKPARLYDYEKQVTNMDWGKSNRLARIFPDGKTLMLAADHGYFMGPTTKLENPRQTLMPLIPHVDALMTTRGVIRNCISSHSNVPVVLRVSGGPTMAREPRRLEDEWLTTSIEDALRLNACAVALQTFSGTDYESRTIKHLAELVNEGEKCGMPVLGVVALGDEYTNKSNDPRYLAMACRILAEHGAAFVKTYYCDGFDKVVDGCYVPLVVAGGPQPKDNIDKDMFTFELAHKAIQDGASGLDFGRKVWQSENPIGVARALHAIVHKNFTAKEAYDLFNETKIEKLIEE